MSSSEVKPLTCTRAGPPVAVSPKREDNRGEVAGLLPISPVCTPWGRGVKNGPSLFRGPRQPVEIEIHGQLATLLRASKEGTIKEPESMGALVAGARNHLNLLFNAPRLEAPLG